MLQHSVQCRIDAMHLIMAIKSLTAPHSFLACIIAYFTYDQANTVMSGRYESTGPRGRPIHLAQDSLMTKVG